jgi:acyl transferase domain-containing protein/acyl carrier protein
MNKQEENKMTGLEIAVIGMAGRFPGAGHIDEFWNNLKNGVESIFFLSDQELEEAGISKEVLQNPNYVKANSLLKDKEYFDSSFFGYTPREAEVMDPQVRLFHEVSWHALEEAGYNPFTYKGLIGIYAGSANSFNWQARSVLSGKSNVLGDFAKALLHNSDLLTQRISHKLDLKGPSFSLFTACSTSLVAIHLACRALITGECSMALAGGVHVTPMQVGGYFYQEGGILSPDGCCRAFDARAKGSVFGEGIGVVVLKRAKDAVGAGDHIYAIIKGSAVNNDGMSKVDFPAPGIKGQASVVRKALKLARVAPESIGYIEVHGTATSLGDPIEISALKKVFNTGKKRSCALGTVKTNVGHLDAAAGIASFIKTVLALKHRLIPPSLHFETPNPGIDFENGPFYVNTGLQPWENNQHPLRAGVSSFGIGGTNAHIVLEEAPGISGSVGQWVSESVREAAEGTRGLAPLPIEDAPVIGHSSSVIGETGRIRDYQLILLSAKTESALKNMTRNLVEFLKLHPDMNLADAAYTLQVGRKAFRYRRMLVSANAREAVAELSSNSKKVQTFLAKTEDPPVIFMFPGLGGQYVNMGRDLYEKEPLFQEEMNRCFEILNGLLDYDIKEILYPYPDCRGGSPDPPKDCVGAPGQGDHKGSPLQSDHINHPGIAQVVVFIFEYALARLLMEWGIQPRSMIGYSFGEYAAACTAGVFSLEDALKLVVTRGRLMEKVPPGAMLSVPLSRAGLAPLLPDELSLAVDNGESCIVAGETRAVESFEAQMKGKKYLCMRLPATRAVHSKMMESILTEFKETLVSLTLSKPQIPYISNVTGDWLTDQEAENPGYWATHLRQTVRFTDGIVELMKEPDALFLEIGPGRDLTTLVKRYIEARNNPGQQVVNLVRHPQQERSDTHFLLSKLGHLWLLGTPVNWHKFHAGARPCRVSLPTYPFEGQRYWIDDDSIKHGLANQPANALNQRKPDMSDWFYTPLWQQIAPRMGEALSLENSSPLNWLIFVDECGVGTRLAERLQQSPQRQKVIMVRMGENFGKTGDREYTIDPACVNVNVNENDYDCLFKELRQQDLVPRRIVHCWNVTGNHRVPPTGPGFEEADKIQDIGIYSLLNIAQAIGRQGITGEVRVIVVTDHLQEVTGDEQLHPEKAALMGAVKVIPLEYANISCRSIDILVHPPSTRDGPNRDTLTGLLLEEVMSDSREVTAAIRGNYRWTQTYKPVLLEKPGETSRRLKKKGVYLVTGGLGGIGFTLAEYLAQTINARLILTTRSGFPPRGQWDQWLQAHAHDENDDVSTKIRRVRELEESGAQIMIAKADVTDFQQMQAVMVEAAGRFGPINGVIHAAGLIDYAGVIQRRTRQDTQGSMAPRVMGTWVLDCLFKNVTLDFFILCSSIGNVLYKDRLGQVGFIASNEFLETYAYYKNRTGSTFTLTIAWCDWRERGMVVKFFYNKHKGNKEKIEAEMRALGPYAVSLHEGVELFCRVLDTSYPRVLISPPDLDAALRQMNRPEEKEPAAEASPPGTFYPRPELDTEYVAPTNQVEQTLALIFQDFLGIRQVGIHDDFFELGGNSLTAIGAISLIHKELQKEVPLVELFNRPTIKQLAQYIRSAEKYEFSPLQSLEKKEYYVLSAAQRRLYIMQQMEKKSTGYNQTFVVLLEGDIHKNRLETAVVNLARRHEMLRTTFELVGGVPVQVVHHPDRIRFVIDYYQANEEEAREMIKHLVKPFDLDQLPLFRLIPVKLQEKKDVHILMLDIHHIISDGVGNNIFMRELTSLYMGEDLPPLNLQYKDFAQWYRQRFGLSEIKRQEAYWLKMFPGNIPVLHLPTDYERPAVQSFTGDILFFDISVEETEALDKIAQEAGATLFMAVLAIYSILLSKLSGQEDIVVGTAAAGRGHVDLENIIGMFVNTVALRNRVDGEKTFRELLTCVRENTLMAFDNQDYQFEDLVDAVVKQRDMSRNPIFDAILVFQNIEDSRGRAGKSRQPSPLQIRPYNFKSQAARFDLNLQGFFLGPFLSFSLEYCTALFKRERIEWFIRYFKNIAASVTADPGKKISGISMIYEKEKNDLLSQFGEDLENE